ncbi:MAG: signal peptidase II [Candidatus Omnitrophica bacterium]|nr:signal peptidase II [Candidatus Omnitrophota bacterium]
MIRIILLVVFLLDQLSKSFVLRHMSLNQSIPVLPPIFSITLIANTGVAFGLFKEKSDLFVWVGLLVLFWIYQVTRHTPLENRWAKVGVGLISGGALGNLLDRLRHGYVVDFLDFRVWPVFNIADSCIFIGTLLFLIVCFKPSH